MYWCWSSDLQRGREIRGADIGTCAGIQSPGGIYDQGLALHFCRVRAATPTAATLATWPWVPSPRTPTRSTKRQLTT